MLARVRAQLRHRGRLRARAHRRAGSPRSRPSTRHRHRAGDADRARKALGAGALHRAPRRRTSASRRRSTCTSPRRSAATPISSSTAIIKRYLARRPRPCRPAIEAMETLGAAREPRRRRRREGRDRAPPDAGRAPVRDARRRAVPGNIVTVKPFGLVVQIEGTGATGTVAIEALPDGPYRVESRRAGGGGPEAPLRRRRVVPGEDRGNQRRPRPRGAHPRDDLARARSPLRPRDFPGLKSGAERILNESPGCAGARVHPSQDARSKNATERLDRTRPVRRGAEPAKRAFKSSSAPATDFSPWSLPR